MLPFASRPIHLGVGGVRWLPPLFPFSSFRSHSGRYYLFVLILLDIIVGGSMFLQFSTHGVHGLRGGDFIYEAIPR